MIIAPVLGMRPDRDRLVHRTGTAGPMGAAATPPTFGRIAEGVTVPLATGDGSGLLPALRTRRINDIIFVNHMKTSLNLLNI